MTSKITPADLASDAFAQLIATHKLEMLDYSPPDSSHALPIDGLRAPGISVYALHVGDQLVGCGALKEIDPGHCEIKSMHMRADYRGQGLATAMLVHLIGVARERGCNRVSLETGAADAFIPARQLYETYGFTYCEPFKGYEEDIHSVFMTLVL